MFVLMDISYLCSMIQGLFKAVRKNLKLTQKEMSEILDCDCKTIGVWENSDSFPFIKLLDICKKYPESELVICSLIAKNNPNETNQKLDEILKILKSNGKLK